MPFDGSSDISDASQIETDTPTVIVTSNVTGLANLDDEDVYIVTVEDADGLSQRNGAEKATGSTNVYNLNNFDQLPAILRNIKDNICRGTANSQDDLFIYFLVADVCDSAGCSHFCYNHNGVPMCHCPDDLILHTDFKTCMAEGETQGANMCEIENGGCHQR